MSTETQLKTFAEFQKYNFFRTPDWRWERIVDLVERDDGVMGRCTKRDDDFVRQGRSFHARWRNGDAEMRQKLLWENPGLYYAYDYHQKLTEDADAAMYIQARLLARQTHADIADVMGLHPEAIKWYSKLYFDVEDHLEKRDWITKQILVPAMMRSAVNPAQPIGEGNGPYKDSTVAKPFLDGSLKLFAYFGGRHLVDIMIAGLQAGKPLGSPDDMDQWFDNSINTTLRRRTAQASLQFEINKYNVMELFAVHSRLMEISNSDEAQQQTKTVQERHIKETLDEIPWAVGTEGQQMYKEHMGIVGYLDDMPAELRADEVLLIASGQAAPTVQTDFPRELPPPKREKKAKIMSENTELP